MFGRSHRRRWPARVWIGAVIGLFLACAPESSAASRNLAGTTTANFLKIGTQAHAVGLAEAVTARTDGVSFVGYNPASARIKSLMLSATHTALYDGVQLEEVILGLPMGKNAGLFLRGHGISFKKIDRTDVNGNITGLFGSASYAAGAGLYARFGRLSLGLFGKTIQQKIDIYKSSTVAGDAGIRYETRVPGLSLGASVLNVGRPAKFITQEDELPRAFRAGVGCDWGFFKLSVDGVQYSDQKAFLSAGGELTLFGGLGLRAGYSDHSDISSPFKAGIGFKFSSLEFNYAYNPSDDFGAAHRVTLTIR